MSLCGVAREAVRRKPNTSGGGMKKSDLKYFEKVLNDWQDELLRQADHAIVGQAQSRHDAQCTGIVKLVGLGTLFQSVQLYLQMFYISYLSHSIAAPLPISVCL